MLVFPLHHFNPGVLSADVTMRVISGGTAINDVETTIQTDGGGRWEGTLGEIDLDEPFYKRLWEAWSSHLAGGARPFLMPVPSLDTAPAPSAGRGVLWPSDIVTDDEYFPTYARFAKPWIEAETVGVSGSPPSVLTIAITRGSRLTPGMRFGMGGNRAYKIERITDRDGQQATCIISPPCRVEWPDATPLNFDWPLVQCKAVIGQNLRPDYGFGYATTSLAFVEDFTDVG
ncbi:hypothetical protein WG907_04315 [Sphingobium sp. AN558]|uniref:hypothetical protein n=1 Tax=Sphingobium sp. AN558 TaxID=3133442 RepID=UPI0030BE460A